MGGGRGWFAWIGGFTSSSLAVSRILPPPPPPPSSPFIPFFCLPLCARIEMSASTLCRAIGFWVLLHTTSNKELNATHAGNYVAVKTTHTHTLSLVPQHGFPQRQTRTLPPPPFFLELHIYVPGDARDLLFRKSNPPPPNCQAGETGFLPEYVSSPFPPNGPP